MSALAALLEENRREGLFSGAAYAVGTTELVLEAGAVGTTAWGASVPVTSETMWDIASITKPIVALEAMLLVESGQIRPDSCLGDLLTSYGRTDKAAITVAQLLTHSSGIPGQQPLYLKYPTREQLLRSLPSLPLSFAPGCGVEYSSQGFMVLGRVIERVTGKPLDELLEASVLRPLGMASTMFRPPAWLEPRTAATELCPWRGRLVKGTVHDENADVLGGIAGHAGLFSTADDVARLGRVMLAGGRLDGDEVFSEKMIASMTEPRTDHLRLRRCYGWQGADPDGCPVGPRVSGQSYGHTGFTGTSLWVDPPRRFYVVLLTNAVHPRRRPERLKQLRPRFHDLVVQMYA